MGSLATLRRNLTEPMGSLGQVIWSLAKAIWSLAELSLTKKRPEVDALRESLFLGFPDPQLGKWYKGGIRWRLEAQFLEISRMRLPMSSWLKV